MPVKDLLAQACIFLDTETTGLGPDAQICEICVVDTSGAVLLETLVRPSVPIPPDATGVHGITDADVATAPAFPEVWANLRPILAGRVLVIYNADYDTRLIRQSLAAHGLQDSIPCASCVCAMELYAEYWGDYSEYHGNYRWQRLGDAAWQQRISLDGIDLHRARADAEITRRLLHVMAQAAGQTEVPPQDA